VIFQACGPVENPGRFAFPERGFILFPMSKVKAKIIKELSKAYAMELETVQNYIAASVNLDGVRSKVIKEALAADVAEELTHAQTLAKRIKTIGGIVPGSLSLERGQKSLQPPKATTDIIAVIKGVIEAEDGAIAQYNKIIKTSEGEDYVTQDLAIGLLSAEEEHRREFIGFLKEYEKPE
jgi:bacterioferritin